MTITIQRITEGFRATLAAHFMALPAMDRNLRFGTSLAPAAIASYVDHIDFARDAVFGVHDAWGALVGAAHVAIEGNVAEVGLSVLPLHRGCGMGGELFRRAAAYARERRTPRLIMHFILANTPIVRIARRFRMSIVGTSADARAHLDLSSDIRMLATEAMGNVRSASE